MLIAYYGGEKTDIEHESRRETRSRTRSCAVALLDGGRGMDRKGEGLCCMERDIVISSFA